jgi:hypothetical protein
MTRHNARQKPSISVSNRFRYRASDSWPPALLPSVFLTERAGRLTLPP